MLFTLVRRSALPTAVVAAALSLASCSATSNASGGPGNAPAASPTGSIAGIACGGGSINASGSSAQANAVSQWVSTYQKACDGSTINYAATGSGAGIADFINDQVAFAGSDAAISGDDLTNANKRCPKGQAINLPMVGGAVAVAYHLSGVDKLIVTPSVLAKIYASTITRWNDPQLAKLNPGVPLPNATIAQFHRADSSGTTANFASYLQATAPSVWTFGNGKDWIAPGGQGSTGSDGIASSVSSTPNSIGYLELSYATNGHLSTAEIDNGTGPVAVSTAAASKAIAAAKVVGTAPDLTLQLDYRTQARGAYPLVLVTYEIVCSAGNDSSTFGLTQSFLKYLASKQGQAALPSLDYSPLPSSLASRVRTAVDGIS